MLRHFIQAYFCRLFSILSSVAYGLVSLKLIGVHLSVAHFGVIAPALTLMQYIGCLDGGFRTSVNYRLLSGVEATTRRRLIRFCQSFYALYGVAALIGASLFMTFYYMSPNIRQSGIGYLFFLCLGWMGSLIVISTTQVNLLVGLRKQSQTHFLMGLNYWMLLAGLAAGLIMGWGIWAFPLSSLVSFAVVFPLSVLMIRLQEPAFHTFRFRFDKEFRGDFVELKKEAWPCFRSQVAIFLLFSIDLILVSQICTLAEAGIYAVLTRVFAIARNSLQSTGEAAWPMIAEDSGDSSEFSGVLLRFNAWMYGGALGAIAVTLIPFVSWYMGGETWSAPPMVLYLMILRFWITGLSSPAAYFLLGHGRFTELARYVERELAAAVVLAIPLGLAFGLNGIAASFVIATVFGTFTPILFDYARSIGRSSWAVFGEVYARGAASFLFALGVGAWVMRFDVNGVWIVAAGAFAAAGALALGAGFAMIRSKAAFMEGSLAERLKRCLKCI